MHRMRNPSRALPVDNSAIPVCRCTKCNFELQQPQTDGASAQTGVTSWQMSAIRKDTGGQYLPSVWPITMSLPC